MTARASIDRPLRVGLNLLFLGDGAGGVGRYARELPGALLEAEPETEITVFVARDAPADLRDEPWAARVRWVSLLGGVSSPRTQLGQYLALPALARARRLDVLHSPANAGPVIAPGIASVVSLMDLIWLQHADEWDPDPRAQRATRRWVSHSVRYADRVFAISAAAAEDLISSLGIERERIAVTPLGVRRPAAAPTPEADLRGSLKLGEARVLLCVAQKRRYKNLDRLVRALAGTDPDVVLVLPGRRTAYEDELRRLAVGLGVDARLRTPQWLGESDLAGLYALSEAFILPSLTEGFGLPVLEAMAHDLPVACSDIPALREVAGDAALLFDPHDQGGVDRAVGRLLADERLRRDLVQLGRARARSFTWARTGRRSLEGYRAAIAGGD